MTNRPTSRVASALVTSAASTLRLRKEDVDRLNVFPVPDGDTGTNMSLTMDSVVAAVADLADDASLAAVCHAMTHGSLMGARGNSGVILSQIIRGLCEGIAEATAITPRLVADAFERATSVAFQAVRKPVEGTMLTVLRDSASAAAQELSNDPELSQLLDAITQEAFASVRRTPDLLPVLKEAGVVDAGGYGLALLFEGAAASVRGGELHLPDVSVPNAPLSVTPADDWDDSEFLYCTEFLVHGHELDRDALEEYAASMGGSQLVVGDAETLKVHVHTDHPGVVLAHVTGLGEISEVHINNMRRQTETRSATISASAPAAVPSSLKPVGFVAVAAGSGLEEILRSLGVDAVVTGGQTMNPSTADLLAAVESVPAERIIVMPDNRNIIMTAQQLVGVASKPVAVVATSSVPQAFAAMLAYDASADFDANVANMCEASETVRTGEVTTAVKDSTSPVGPISIGQIIGIADHEIVAIGDDLASVAESLLDTLATDAETVTLLAGSDLPDAEFEQLTARLRARHPELEMDAHRGEQPLYPLIMSVE